MSNNLCIFPGFISILVLTAIGCGVKSFCRKNDSEDDVFSMGYTGVSNGLRNDRWKYEYCLRYPTFPAFAK